MQKKLEGICLPAFGYCQQLRMVSVVLSISVKHTFRLGELERQIRWPAGPRSNFRHRRISLLMPMHIAMGIPRKMHTRKITIIKANISMLSLRNLARQSPVDPLQEPERGQEEAAGNDPIYMAIPATADGAVNDGAERRSSCR